MQSGIRSQSQRRAASLAVLVVIPLALGLLACQEAPSVETGNAATDENTGEATGDATETPAPPFALAPSGRPYSEERAPCADRTPERQALWGELHVHSSLSMDAWLWDVRNGPDDVYRFAKGETILLPPLDEAGRGTREARLERPLDFAALTDHASFQGEVALCTREGSPAYDTDSCRLYRGETQVEPSPLGDFGLRMGALGLPGPDSTGASTRNPDLCGDDGGKGCIAWMRSVWEEQQAATERHYDRSSACRFTALHGYEYTATPDLAKVHHNVVFRNANLPAAPIAWIDEPDVYGLWRRLAAECRDAGTGCDVVTLPHNSNLSNGNMFAVSGKELPLPEQQDRARLRGDLERLVEISQIKGDSECRNGFAGVVGATDEFCEYEEWRGPEVEDCGADGVGRGALLDRGCVSRKDYVRYALVEGFREQARIGVNPFKLGIVAATDTHNANPGDVEERRYRGWAGASDATRDQRLAGRASPINATYPALASPGGLAGVWAEENSRDAIFDALKRRETFGTSGPRMTARFFGSWDYPADLCDDPALVTKGYAGGVAMGGDLPARPDTEAAPVFVVSAMQDPGTASAPGNLLQRAQIVKGWIDDAGDFRQEVIDVAGGPNEANVDPATCAPRGPGRPDLCRVWTDPDFDPARPAVYYVRVLENPSCRWSAWQCLEEATDPTSDGPSPACTDPTLPKTIQERLWTSPIWYEPTSTGDA